MTAADSAFARLLDVVRCDPRVVGLVLGGSRGKPAGYVTELSDYDAYVIVTDTSVLEEYAARFPTSHGDPVEVILVTLDSFRGHALPGSGSEWNAYTFAHVKPLLDKLDGEITDLVAEKARRDPASAAGPLDGYINMYYRAAKNHRDGLYREAHLDAAESIPWFLEFVFTADGRVRPYNKWLPWELMNHPLPDPWSAEDILRRTEAIVATGDLPEQQMLFCDVDEFARELGFAAVIDGWGPDVVWLRGGSDLAGHSRELGQQRVTSPTADRRQAWRFSDQRVLAAVKQHWSLAEPMEVASLSGGSTSHTWLIRAGAAKFIAKFAYEAREVFERGLRGAAVVEAAGIPSGRPIPAVDGAMTVMLEGPPGYMHPLALLEFVPGDPISSDDARRDETVGRVLGTVQRVLNDAGYGTLFDASVGIYDYLEDRHHTIAESDWIYPMLSTVVAEARATERDCPPTVGICYGDGVELRRDPSTGAVGLVDWGAVQRGPLLLDIAFQEARFAPGSPTWRVNQSSPELLAAYLGEAPVNGHELALLPSYRALAWARALRYNAHHVAHGANWGRRSQALSRQRLRELRANAPEAARM